MKPSLENSDGTLMELCHELDDLALQQIDRVEEQLLLMKKLEAEMATGFINLAKSRYITGERSVSMLQVPSDESEFEAAVKIDKDPNGLLQLAKNSNGVDAKKWFGVLVPSSLRQSQQSFEKAVQLIVSIINLRREWLEAMDEYNQKSISKTA